MRRAQIALIVVLVVGASPAEASPALTKGQQEVAGITLPPRSRRSSDNSFSAAAGFKKTVIYFERYLRRRALSHRQVPVLEARGVLLSRFLSEDVTSSWTAIQIYQIKGVTSIFIVPAKPTPAPRALPSNEKAQRP